MKILILFILYFSVTAALRASLSDIAELETNVTAVLETWKESHGLENLDSERLNELRIKLHGNRPNVWNMHPSRLSELRARIEPLRDLALQLAKSENENQRYHAASLIAYLEPTEETKLTLLSLARDKHSSTAATSLDTLFGMGWDTPELRQELIQDLERIADGEKSQTLAFTNVGEWGVVEAVPAMVKILERTYFDKTIQGRGILRQFRYLGQDATAALPTLEKILAQRTREGDADFRELEELRYAVQAVRNGGIIQESWSDLESTTKKQNRTSKSLHEGRDAQIRSPKTSKTRGSIEEANSETKSIWSPWAVGGVILLGILALLFKVWKSKAER